ncbi:MAG TPA: 16S rRNA (adenine(1518)-N(6)/adenine(1519)-N(6))-dimethyltransferase RsmA [Egibacteraceae bacterium]|nr:16S rRNA (adenine(1518)-N(6)/adenine(1519)-N(6))-dimethyltransferase RsmA [Egibacteraceae bacterium]
MALLTPADVRRLLAAHGVHPRKARGQNFVVDPNTVRKVVRDAGVGDGDVVCEVGPGLGSLTLALREAGARVVAVEIDEALARALAEVVAGDVGVRIVQADALRVDLGAVTDEAARAWQAADAPRLLVANLPYNVATPILMEALATRAFARILVMVQKEVGRRWAAQPRDELYGAVSVKVAAQADVRVAAQVSRSAFHPVPNVDSVTVRLEPRPWAWPVEREALFRLVEAGFAQRRKRLRNSLSRADLAPAAVEDALERAGLDAGARAEELAVAQWVALAGELQRGG